jgi:hypothetical protein
MSDWFRNEEWSPEIEQQFFLKLDRARNQKAQYLRVQACHLSERRPEVALSLLDHYFQMEEQVDRAQAFVDRAHAFDASGDWEQSATSFEKALVREREFPNYLTQAGFEFPLFVATHKMTNRYDVAFRVIEDYRPKATLPKERFYSFAASALIAAELGSNPEGAEFARQALSAAAMQSPFPRHSDVGLVDSKYDGLKAQLQKLTLGDK